MKQISVCLGMTLNLFALMFLFWEPLSFAQQALSIREGLLSRPLTPELGGETTRAKSDADAFKNPAANIQGISRASFVFGNQMFTTVWTPPPGLQPTTDGLGPVFNREACSDCHANNGRGRPPVSEEAFMDSILVRLSVPGTNAEGGPKPVPNYGDQLQNRAVEGVPVEGRAIVRYEEIDGTFEDGTLYSLRRPTLEFKNLSFGDLPDDTLTSLRVANLMIGLGLLAAVPEDTLVALADAEDADGDGISGRVNQVWDAVNKMQAVGRFGWKANVPSLAHQSAGAARGDMGITTPVFPTDNCDEAQSACTESTARHDGLEMSEAFLDRLIIYVSLIAVPRQRNAEVAEVMRGEVLFRSIGCAGCHMPTLVSGEDESIPEVSNQVFHPFTDLLLHDMGEGLADGRPDFGASGQEWRTAPLWGLGLTETVSGHNFYLHDGRARSLAEAILWHGGEAESAREAFRGMDESSRNALIAFLKSL